MKRSTSQLEMTNFYFQGSLQKLRLIEKDFDSSVSDEEKFEEKDNSDDENFVSGFAGWETNDISYKAMLEHFDFSLEYEEMGGDSDEEGMSDIAWAICKNRSPMFQARMEPIPVQLKADIIVNWLYRHKKRETVARENGINVEQVNNIIYEFATIKRTGKKERKATNLLRRKLYGWHSKFLKEFAENNFEKGFTLVNARRALLNEFSDINDISLSSLSYLFRKQLKFSYKKLGLSNPTKARSENKSNLLFWIKLIASLVNDGFHVVFLDEFMVNRETTKTYGWARRGQPGRLLEKPWDFKMSFIVAHSPASVEGLVGTTTTFNKIKYADFLKSLIAKLKNDPEIEDEKIVVVADNWRFHRADKIKRLFVKERLLWLFIPPYSPEANACEKLINFIKVHIKNQVTKQRYSASS